MIVNLEQIKEVLSEIRTFRDRTQIPNGRYRGDDVVKTEHDKASSTWCPRKTQETSCVSVLLEISEE